VDSPAAPPRLSTRPPALLSWSSGKDSAYSLHVLRQQDQYEIVGLLTTVNSEFSRVSMHGVREEILERQAAAAGLPLVRVRIPFPCPNEVYERAMTSAMEDARRRGIHHVAFGDLFLEDIRAYRESKMASIGMECLFPLWGRPTAALAREMIATGLQARLACVDPRKLDPSFAGRSFDSELLGDLPSSVDPCGELGEFHTCVTGGPMFHRSIPVRTGEIVERDGFVFADLLLSD
jgi:uncharacterized protein (TIGR00290 family)